jgi:hypothetical protein
MGHRCNEIDRGKQTYSGKNLLSATLSTTNPTWTDPGSNPGLRGKRPATNLLSHGTAFVMYYNAQNSGYVSNLLTEFYVSSILYFYLTGKLVS